jgi:polar amino acid transport system substrate-binding protein
VGISADYPPVIFKKDGQLQGMEVDFAHALANNLDRKVQFIELPWSSLISSLNSGRIDIIMSGMSITKDRSHQVQFSDPYFTISQMLLVRRSEMSRFRKPGNNYYVNSNFIIGVAAGTTGEELARKHLPQNRVLGFKSVQEGAKALKAGHIDCFLHDAPTIWSYADGHDPVIAGIFWEFGQEQLAWAVSKGNRVLHREIKTVTDKWRINGTSAKIVSKWVPTRVTYK